MLLNEIMGTKAKDLKSLKWEDLSELISEVDGGFPSNDGPITSKFKKASLPPKPGMWDGWGFVYELKYKDIDGEQVTDEWVVSVTKDGKLDINALDKNAAK